MGETIQLVIERHTDGQRKLRAPGELLSPIVGRIGGPAGVARELLEVKRVASAFAIYSRAPCFVAGRVDERPRLLERERSRV
jgi:hypothetical protein